MYHAELAQNRTSWAGVALIVCSQQTLRGQAKATCLKPLPGLSTGARRSSGWAQGPVQGSSPHPLDSCRAPHQALWRVKSPILITRRKSLQHDRPRVPIQKPGQLSGGLSLAPVQLAGLEALCTSMSLAISAGTIVSEISFHCQEGYRAPQQV